jgi:hypothetical protein
MAVGTNGCPVVSIGKKPPMHALLELFELSCVTFCAGSAVLDDQGAAVGKRATLVRNLGDVLMAGCAFQGLSVDGLGEVLGGDLKGHGGSVAQAFCQTRVAVTSEAGVIGWALGMNPRGAQNEGCPKNHCAHNRGGARERPLAFSAAL